MPKLSIIVPVYNVEKYLSICIESILHQSFKDYELLLVNDGSTDSSGEICNEFAQKDNRVKVYHQRNAGPSEARNLGIRKSLGTFITFIDSDDIVKNDFLSNFSFSSYLDFEIQGFEINYIESPNKNKIISFSKTEINELKDVYRLAELNLLSRGPVCKLFKSGIIKDNGIDYPKGIQFGEDAIFVKRYLLCCNGKGRIISKADYLYNHYPNSSSLTNKKIESEALYSASFIDFELYQKLSNKWGNLGIDLNEQFYRKRILEFYLSVYNLIFETDKSAKQKVTFLNRIKNEMFPKIKDIKNLPVTYKIIRFTLLYFSSSICLSLLSLFFVNCKVFFKKSN